MSRAILNLLVSTLWLAVGVSGQMSESPFQLTISHDLIRKVINSSKQEILHLFDNLRPNAFQVMASDYSEPIEISGLRFQSNERTQPDD
jgi:hypothetical protein